MMKRIICIIGIILLLAGCTTSTTSVVKKENITDGWESERIEYILNSYRENRQYILPSDVVSIGESYTIEKRYKNNYGYTIYAITTTIDLDKMLIWATKTVKFTEKDFVVIETSMEIVRIGIDESIIHRYHNGHFISSYYEYGEEIIEDLPPILIWDEVLYHIKKIGGYK